MKVIKNEQLNTTKWNNLIKDSDYSSPFQTNTYYEVLKNTANFDSEVFASENEKGQYTSLCVVSIQHEPGIKSIFSKRAIIYGGIVILNEKVKKHVDYLLKVIEKDLRRKVIYIEIRNYFDFRILKPIFNENRWKYLPYLNIKVPLAGNNLEEIIKKFKYNRRREIKLTISNGITYRIANSKDDILTLHNILLDLYKSQVGLPVPESNYFIQLWEKGLLQIFLVCDSDTIIGGSYCMFLEGKGIYTYYYCSLKEHKKQTWPTHLSVLAAINFGLEKDMKFLDFMGAGVEMKNEGIRKYKMAFGGHLHEEGRYLKITKPLLFWIGKQAIKFLKKK